MCQMTLEFKQLKFPFIQATNLEENGYGSWAAKILKKMAKITSLAVPAGTITSFNLFSRDTNSGCPTCNTIIYSKWLDAT